MSDPAFVLNNGGNLTGQDLRGKEEKPFNYGSQPVGTRFDFEVLTIVTGQLVTTSSNRQVTVTVLIRPENDDPYLLKNVNLEVD